MDTLSRFNRQSHRLLAVVLALVLVMVALCSSACSDDSSEDSTTFDVNAEGVYRITGTSNTAASLETASALKKVAEVSKFDAVIVTSDESIVDALSGTYLAKVKTAPILFLAAPDDKAASTTMSLVSGYIEDNLSEDGTIYILGGTGSVTADQEAALSKLGNVTRIAGTDRYATNLDVLNTAGVSDASTLLISTGTSFADSISAASTGLPIMLVGDELTYEQGLFLSQHNFTEICVLGSSEAVSDSILTTLQTYSNMVERIAGSSRYSTSKAIADKFFSGSTKACVTYGESFAAGLAAGPVANLMDAPILLVKEGSTTDAENFLSSNSVTTVWAFATAEELSEDTVNSLK